MKYLGLIILFLAFSSVLKGQSISPADQAQLLDHYQSQRYAEAAKLLQSIYGNDPQDPKTIAMLAYANNMAGNLKQAEYYYLKLYEADVKNIPVLFSLAGINARRGNEDKTKAFYKAILSIDSLNFRALKLLASITSSGINDEKLTYLNTANRINPFDGDVAYELAIELNLMKKTTDAYRIIEQAYLADTSNYLLLKAKLPLSLSLKKLKETEIIGNKLLSSGDSSTFVLNTMAKLAMENKAYLEAISFFKVMERYNQQSESSLYYTAVCYQKLNDLIQAKTYTNAAIDFSISPNVSGYYNLLGYLEEASGANLKAQKAYLKALQFEHTGKIYYSLALLQDFKLKNPSMALKYYRQYLQSKPDEQQAENINYTKERIKALTH